MKILISLVLTVSFCVFAPPSFARKKIPTWQELYGSQLQRTPYSIQKAYQNKYGKPWYELSVEEKESFLNENRDLYNQIMADQQAEVNAAKTRKEQEINEAEQKARNARAKAKMERRKQHAEEKLKAAEKKKFADLLKKRKRKMRDLKKAQRNRNRNR